MVLSIMETSFPSSGAVLRREDVGEKEKILVMEFSASRICPPEEVGHVADSVEVPLWEAGTPAARVAWPSPSMT
jgi:hypothetical protein